MSKLYFPTYEVLRQWLFTIDNIDVYIRYATYQQYVFDLEQDEGYTFLILVWLSEDCPNVE